MHLLVVVPSLLTIGASQQAPIDSEGSWATLRMDRVGTTAEASKPKATKDGTAAKIILHPLAKLLESPTYYRIPFDPCLPLLSTCIYHMIHFPSAFGFTGPRLPDSPTQSSDHIPQIPNSGSRSSYASGWISLEVGTEFGNQNPGPKTSCDRPLNSGLAPSSYADILVPSWDMHLPSKARLLTPSAFCDILGKAVYPTRSRYLNNWLLGPDDVNDS